MRPRRVSLSAFTATLRACAAAGLLAGAAAAAGAQPTWTWQVSTGFDAYTHRYHLAADDTTETIRELNAAVQVAGQSAVKAVHQWRLRTELSAGSELVRELVDAGYRWRAEDGESRLRADLTWYGRQYHQTSDYSLASDNHEGRAELRAVPWYGRRAALDVRLLGRLLDYRTPSSLEQDWREVGAGLFARAPAAATTRWELGLRTASRAYPDSAAINRDVNALEFDLDRRGEAVELWSFHRSERRLAADEEVRPSAWFHWTELNLAVAAGAGHVVANLGSEIWRYDRPEGAYFNSWRTEIEAGYRWGDPLASTWHALLTGEHLAAGDSPESYTQLGVRGSYESYLHALSGTVALEVGRRWYFDPADSTDVWLDELVTYSDFTYIEIWLMGTWTINPHFELDLIANYQPEVHTEQDDDMELGFASARVVWRQ